MKWAGALLIGYAGYLYQTRARASAGGSVSRPLSVFPAFNYLQGHEPVEHTAPIDQQPKSHVSEPVDYVYIPRFFVPSEFERGGVNWMNQASPELLQGLDRLRAHIGRIRISPHEGALGRHDGESTSQHNVDKWGELRAADIMPLDVDLKTAYDAARQIFGGVGAYPYWLPLPGLHVDVGTWGRSWSQLERGGDYVAASLAWGNA